MDSSPSELQSLSIRVETLERQNRLLKRAGFALILLPVCLAVMGQAGSERTIEAQDFVLRDPTGIKRAELSMGKYGPFSTGTNAVLQFFNSKGQPTSIVNDGFVFLVPPENKKAAPVGSSPFGAYVMLSTRDEEPDLVISDTQGFQAHLGVTDTVTTRTGEQHKSTAASVTLLGPPKDNKVIWSAP
jgi:hypothetical protein